jgi:capsular polysaccharide biosynthesis protein
MGFLAGIFSGFGLAFFKEQWDSSFKDAEDVETTLGLKVLANIPQIKISKA